MVEKERTKRWTYFHQLFRPVSRYTSDEGIADYGKLVWDGQNQQRAAKRAEVRAAAVSRVFGGVGLQTEILEDLDSDLGIRVAELEDVLATLMRVFEAPNKRHGRQQGEQSGIQGKQGRLRGRETKGQSNKRSLSACSGQIFGPGLSSPWMAETDFTSRRHVGIAGKGLQDFSLVDIQQTRIKGMSTARRADTWRVRSKKPSESEPVLTLTVFSFYSEPVESEHTQAFSVPLRASLANILLYP